MFHPDGGYRTTTNVWSVPFDTTTNYPQPLFGVNLTNRLWIYLLYDASGRVIDYVQLTGMESRQDLLSEIGGSIDDFGPGGVWDTNRIDGRTNDTEPILGIENQIQASLGNPPYVVQGYSTPVTVNDWVRAGLPAGFSSVSQAVQAFQIFYNVSGSPTNLVMEVPYTPIRQISVYSTWQANDPLVHYTVSDVTGVGDFSTAPRTNFDATITALVQTNLVHLSSRYLPWGGAGNSKANEYFNYIFNPAIIDPNVTRSDDWNFPNGPLSAGWIEAVHRGTPWQTVYLKSAPVDPVTWQKLDGQHKFNGRDDFPAGQRLAAGDGAGLVVQSCGPAPVGFRELNRSLRRAGWNQRGHQFCPARDIGDEFQFAAGGRYYRQRHQCGARRPAGTIVRQRR